MHIGNGEYQTVGTVDDDGADVISGTATTQAAARLKFNAAI